MLFTRNMPVRKFIILLKRIMNFLIGMFLVKGRSVLTVVGYFEKMILYYIYNKAQTNASFRSATAFNVRPSYVCYFTAYREFFFCIGYIMLFISV